MLPEWFYDDMDWYMNAFWNHVFHDVQWRVLRTPLLSWLVEQLLYSASARRVLPALGRSARRLFHNYLWRGDVWCQRAPSLSIRSRPRFADRCGAKHSSLGSGVGPPRRGDSGGGHRDCYQKVGFCDFEKGQIKNQDLAWAVSDRLKCEESEKKAPELYLEDFGSALGPKVLDWGRKCRNFEIRRWMFRI